MRAPRADSARGRAALVAALTFALIVFAAPATHACSVCYGADPTSPWAAGINSGIYVLLGVTAFVLGWFAVVILTIRSRARRWQSRKDALHVVTTPAAASAAGPGPNASKA